MARRRMKPTVSTSRPRVIVGVVHEANDDQRDEWCVVETIALDWSTDEADIQAQWDEAVERAADLNADIVLWRVPVRLLPVIINYAQSSPTVQVMLRIPETGTLTQVT